MATSTALPKLSFSSLPTPLWRNDALDRLCGCEVWVKRDDMTAGAAAGNKIRKLEYLLADAVERRSTAVVTCGGLQSNHCRATAIAARQVGLRPVVLLRSTDPEPDLMAGNAFLDLLVGAEVRIISPAQYAERARVLQETADELSRSGERPYVIPEGGSNGLGALGYVDAVAEVRTQLDRDASLPRGFDAVVHACGSGGTAAGIALGLHRTPISDALIAVAVCDDVAYFEQVVARIIAEARVLCPELEEPRQPTIADRFKGPAYGVPSAEQVRFITEVARQCGLIVDPVYTGKALYGLAHLTPKPRRVLFVHTGGLPGLLAQSGQFNAALRPR